MACDQTHGLMADGSQGYQQQQVDFFCCDGGLEVWDQFVFHPILRVDTAHTGIVVGGQVTNDALLFQLGKRLGREDSAWVLTSLNQVVFRDDVGKRRSVTGVSRGMPRMLVSSL